MKRICTIILALCVLFPCGAQADGQRLKVGVALGGGGAKGAAEIGVLKVIEEAGIPIDYIAGTSIGSIVGGFYAAGYKVQAIDSLFRTQEWISLFAGEVIKGENIERVFSSVLQLPDSVNFDELMIPYRCVTVDFMTATEVVLSNGSLPKAMRASMSIPGAFKPVKWGDMMLVDGGMLNNLPVDVVRAMGADIVIAVDLTQKKPKPNDFSLKEQLGIGGLIDWVVSRPDKKKYADNCADADLYINPDLAGYAVTSFTPKAIAEMIARGEREGEKHKKALRQIKEKIYNSVEL